MNTCPNCGARIDASTGWVQVGEGDADYPAGTLVCLGRRCMPGSQRPAPGQPSTSAVR